MVKTFKIYKKNIKNKDLKP